MLKRGLLLLLLLILTSSLVVGLTSLKLDKTNLKPGDILRISITNGENGYLNKVYFYSDSLVDIVELDCGREICYGAKTLDFEIPEDWDGKYSVVVYDYGLHDYSKKEFSVVGVGMNKDYNSDKFSDIKQYETDYTEEQNLIVVNINLPSLIREKIAQAGEEYTKLTVPGLSFHTKDVGLPQIPFVVERIQIPTDAVNIKIDAKPNIEDKEDNILLYPSPREVIKEIDDSYTYIAEEFYIDEESYKKDSFIPNSIVKINQDGYFRSMRMLELYIYPVQYNPKQKLLKFYNSIEVTVSYDLDTKKKPKKDALKGFEEVADSLVLNYKNIGENDFAHSETSQTGSVVYLTRSDLRDINNQIDYLVITHSDFYGSTSLRNLLNYRANYSLLRIGVAKVQDIYPEFPNTNGNDYSIKDFTIYAYENWEVAPQYLLLVGDLEWVPSHIAGGGENDDWVAYVAGVDDEWADMAVGRLSIRNAQELENIRRKIYAYEQNPIISGDYHSNVLVAWGSNRSTCSVFYPITAAGYKLSEYCGINAEQDIINAMNIGQNFVHYGGHGGPSGWHVGFSIWDIPVLNNTNKYFITTTQTCASADLNFTSFDGQGSLGEELVKARDKGAVAYYGCTVECAGNPSSLFLLKIFNEFDYTIGKAMLEIETLMLGSAWVSILLGDPALQMMGYKLNENKPDLTLASGDMFYNIATRELTVNISNIGNVDAYNVHVDVFVYEDSVKHPPFADFYVNHIPAGTSIKTSLTVDFPLPPREYLFAAKVDPENLINEIFELNNQNGLLINTTYSPSIITLIDVYGSYGSELRIYDVNWSYINRIFFDERGQAYAFLPENMTVIFSVFYRNELKYHSYMNFYREVTTPANVTIVVARPSTITIEHNPYPPGQLYWLIGRAYPLSEWSYSGTGWSTENGTIYLYVQDEAQFYFDIVKNGTTISSSSRYNPFTAPVDILLKYPKVKVMRGGVGVSNFSMSCYDEGGYTNLSSIITYFYTNYSGMANSFFPVVLPERRFYCHFYDDILRRYRYTDVLVAPFEYLELNLNNQYAPELNVPYNSINLRYGENLTLDISATDLDSNYLYFSAKNLPSGARLIDHNDRTATLIWNPNINQTGVYDVTLKVTDGFLNDTQNLRISFSDIPNLATHTFQTGWNLISLPLQPDNPNPDSVFSGIDITMRLHRYDTEAGYVTYDRLTGRFGDISVEDGYWLWCEAALYPDGCTVSYSGIDVANLIPLDLAGWHLVGVPSIDDVYVNNIQVEHNGVTKSIIDASTGADKWIELPFKLYAQETNGYLNIGPAGMGTIWDDNYLYPWYGYWIKTNVNDVTLKF